MAVTVSDEDRFDTLVIGASFFGYVAKLIDALKERGRRPVWFEDRPGVDTFSKFVVRVAPKLLEAKISAHVTAIINKVRGHPIKDILVIKGEAISTEHIQSLRKLFPHARFALYLWDSYGNMPPNTREKVSSFDVVFSFDPRDVEQDARLRYRPLFYLPEFRALPVMKQDIDLLFLGTVHSDRFEVTERLARSLPSSLRFLRLCFFPSKKLFYIKRTFRPGYWRASVTDFVFTPIARPKVLDLLARSRAVLDIERSVQTGYTMRTIEAFGASKKLATTNSAIVAADFHHPGNQIVLDRARPRIPAEFFQTDYQPVSEPVVERYTLKSFLDDLGF